MRRRPALLAAAALVVLSVWEIVALLRVHAAAPRDADWRAAADAVRAEHRAGDLVVFAPAWVDPVGRKWLGDLLGVADAARMDDARYGRVWEVAIRGARAPGLTGAVAFDRAFGGVRVRRVERPAARVTWDLAGHERARLFEVDFEPHLCVPLHPPAELDVAAAPLGARLVVYAGIADFRSRRDNRARAIVRVLVDGHEVGQAAVANESGWLRLPDIATEPGPHALSFIGSVDATGPKRADRLDLCVAAEARE